MTKIPAETDFEVEFAPAINAEQRQEVAQTLASAIATDYAVQEICDGMRDMARRTKGQAVSITYSGPTRQRWSNLQTGLRQQARQHACTIKVKFDAGDSFTSSG